MKQRARGDVLGTGTIWSKSLADTFEGIAIFERTKFLEWGGVV